MRFSRKVSSAAAALLVFGLAPAAQAAQITVDIAGAVTGDWGDQSFNTVPFGDNVLLGGTTFDIAEHDGFAGHVVFNTVPTSFATNVFGVTTAYTLLNTFYGQPGPNSFLSVTFNATGGVTQTFNLLGNDDVRDYLQNVFTNSINGTTTQQVLSQGGNLRLDRQRFDLNAAFADQTLTSVVFTDTGGPFIQVGVLTGLTLETAAVPEPAAWALMIGGFGLAGASLRRRRAGVLKADGLAT